MKKIILIAGTNSSKSINRSLLYYAAEKLHDVILTELLMTDYILPLYGIDYEREKGIPESAHEFKNKIKTADGVLISLAEHNGAYTVAFKNVLDWVSRIQNDVWLNKPMLVMSTSPGSRGGVGVLNMFYNRYIRTNKSIVGKFSLPLFSKNLDIDNNHMKQPYETELSALIEKFQSTVDSNQ